MSIDNSEIEECWASNTEGKDIPCDHKYCFDAETCTNTTYEEINTHCKMVTRTAKSDKCVTCGKIYYYP
jgi:hypothetical protein